MLHFFFGFQGRVRRTNFFFGALVTSLVASAFGLHWLYMHNIRWGWDYDAFESVRWSMAPGFWLVGTIVGIGCFWAKLALTVKRWHDTGATGWLALLSLIPLFEFLVFILLCLLPPTRGPNLYGPDPRAEPATA
jgi:uncharacterized membrane protein YhaH (DUF805 family)